LFLFLRCYEKFISSHLMGQKKKSRPSTDTLFETVSRMLVPDYILENFEIYGANELPTCWIIELREKEDKIPIELKGFHEVALDGYCNPIETLSHSFVCKPIYLKVYRRRYKRVGEDKHYSNTYDLTLKGVKMVPELGLFLK
ncbi:MAG: hypothetical protein Q7U47_02290, partial [Paludibacter sp.]|nr:hypothetical protein [Paludibacter sp.]